MSNYKLIESTDLIINTVDSRWQTLCTNYSCEKQNVLQIVLDTVSTYADYLKTYGYHYIFTDTTTDTELQSLLPSLIKYQMDKRFPTLYALTNGFEELTSIPKEDTRTNTHDSTVDSDSLSENQPIDSTDTITTPYAKFKGSHRTATKDLYKDNTVGQAEMKQRMAKGVVFNIQNYIESVCQSFVHEFNTAF